MSLIPDKASTADDVMMGAAGSRVGGSTSTSPTATLDCSEKPEKKRKSFLPRIFSSKRNSTGSSEDNIPLPAEGNGNGQKDLEKSITSLRKAFTESSAFVKRGFSEKLCTVGLESLNLSCSDRSEVPDTTVKDIQVFVGTWNVGGNAPNHGLNLEEFLQVEGSADIYVLGFQEIVPLSAGNVLVMEDNEPASKWLALIHHNLNKAHNDHGSKHSNNSKSNIFNKPSLKAFSKALRGDNELLKACNCNKDCGMRVKKSRDPLVNPLYYSQPGLDKFLSMGAIPLDPRVNYQLVASKQMVGIFLSIWAQRDLMKRIGHVRISCMGRGIMGYLGNKGCISISMTLHQTSFCFVCSHLACGEKEGDELRRNSDVAEILKGTYLPKICDNPGSRIPERILDHDRIIWLGDLNYRVGMSYEEARLFLESNDWQSLLEKDQLIREKEAGRVFNGWKEGKIMFAPTYKYSNNSDSYAGENTKSKRKRRTPAWCDRILWRGSGIEQLSYIRGESRFSDHRPVCAVFAVEVEARNQASTRLRKGYSCASTRLEFHDCIPNRQNLCEF